jgi:hypothetical protein
MHTYKVIYAKDGELFTELVIAFSEEDAKATIKREHPGVGIKSVTQMS